MLGVRRPLSSPSLVLFVALVACGDDRGGAPPMGSGGGGGSIVVPTPDGGPVPFGCRLEDLGILDGGGLLAAEVALAPGAASALLVWAEAKASTHRVIARRLPRDGFAGPPNELDARASALDSPSVLATEDGYLVAWVERTGAAGAEVRLRAVAVDGAPVADRADGPSGPGDQSRPLLVDTAPDPSLLYLEADGSLGRVGLDGDGRPQGAAAPLASGLAGMGTPEAAAVDDGHVVAFADTDAVRVLRIGPGGAALDPAPLALGGLPPSGAVAVAGDGDVGALVYDTLAGGTRPEVRFHALGRTGAPIGAARVLTETPSSGFGASITAYAGGYAVAYFGPRDEGSSAPDAVRLALVDGTGRVATDARVADLAGSGAATALVTSTDGTIFLVWADEEGDTVSLRNARLVCGVGVTPP